MYEPSPAPGHTLPHAYNTRGTPTRKNYFETERGQDFLKAEVTLGASAAYQPTREASRTRVLPVAAQPKPRTSPAPATATLSTVLSFSCVCA